MAIASIASTESKKLPPAPPSCSGISTPINPNSNSFFTRPGANCCSSSIVRTAGAIVSCANFRTVAKNIRSSSVSCVSGEGEWLLSDKEINASGIGVYQNVAHCGLQMM